MLAIAKSLMLPVIVLSGALHPMSLSVKPQSNPYTMQQQPVQVLQAPNSTVQPNYIKTPAKPATGDPTLLSYAKELGIQLPNGMTLVYEKTLPAADDLAANITAGVYYQATNTIYIQTGYTKYQTENLLAYEYMHYVWEDVDSAYQQNIVDAASTNLLETSPTFRTDVEPFVTANVSQGERDDEQDSNACTRLPASQLPALVDAYCAHYIPNRSLIL